MAEERGLAAFPSRRDRAPLTLKPKLKGIGVREKKAAKQARQALRAEHKQKVSKHSAGTLRSCHDPGKRAGPSYAAKALDAVEVVDVQSSGLIDASTMQSLGNNSALGARTVV